MVLLGNRAHHTRGASGHDHSGGACLIRRCLPQGVAHKQGTPTQERTTIGASGTPARAALASQGGACHIVLLRRWVPQPERTTRYGRAVTTARAALAYTGGACHNGRRHPFRVALATRCCSEKGPQPERTTQERALCARAASAFRATLATSGGAILSGWCLPPSVAQKRVPQPASAPHS